jgi:hypothetical protein
VRFLLASVKARVSNFGRYCDAVGASSVDEVEDEVDGVGLTEVLAAFNEEEVELVGLVVVVPADLEDVCVEEVGGADVLARLLLDDAELTVES